MAETEKQTRIIGQTTPFKGNIFFINKPEFTIGRSKDNDLVLSEKTISAHHAKFVLVDQSYELIDMESTNGTYVNNEKINKKTLRTDDVIKFDVYEFRYVHPADVSRTIVSTVPDFSKYEEATIVSAATSTETPTPQPAAAASTGHEQPKVTRSPKFESKGNLVLGLLIGFIFAAVLTLGGNILGVFIDSRYSFDFGTSIHQLLSVFPLLHTHFAWFMDTNMWSLGRILAFICIIVGLLVGGLMTKLLARKNAFLTSLLFSILYVFAAFVAQVIALSSNLQQMQQYSIGIFGIYNGGLSLLALYGYFFVVTFVLSFVGAVGGRR